MQRRLHHIASLVIKYADNSDELLYSFENTLIAVKYLLKLYKREVQSIDDNFVEISFSKLANIIVTIQKIMNLDRFTDIVR